MNERNERKVSKKLTAQPHARAGSMEVNGYENPVKRVGERLIYPVPGSYAVGRVCSQLGRVWTEARVLDGAVPG
jgi:hypothetical protein